MNKNRGLELINILLGMFRQFLKNPAMSIRRVAADIFHAINNQYYAQHLKRLPNVAPLNLIAAPQLSECPTLNVLIPGMNMRHLSGGPNTAINLAYRLAAEGIPVRFISTDVPLDRSRDLLWKHFASLTGITEHLANVDLCNGSDRSRPLMIGENDVFFGTAWWTVQMIKYALPLTRSKKFIYLIQEFEPGLYEFSSRYALAMETYNMNYYGIINEQFLADYLCEHKIGRFAEPAFINTSAVFEPALDARKFCPKLPKLPHSPKRLLFYARPNAPRNLFELGLNALQAAALQGAFSKELWELLFIGETLPEMKLSENLKIRSTPWLNYDAYAELVRDSDIALSLMLSPHTSYPPLEIAACGGIAVTCSFAGKTQEKLQRISRNIIAVPPTVEGIVGGLQEAVERIRTGQQVQEQIHMPTTWDEAFCQVVPKAVKMFFECRNSSD